MDKSFEVKLMARIVWVLWRHLRWHYTEFNLQTLVNTESTHVSTVNYTHALWTWSWEVCNRDFDIIDTNLFAETVRPNFFGQMIRSLFETGSLKSRRTFGDLEGSFLQSLYFRFRFTLVSQWNSVSRRTFWGFWSDFPWKYEDRKLDTNKSFFGNASSFGL